MKRKDKKYLFIYREEAFGEQVERSQVVDLDELKYITKYTNIIKIHLLEHL